MNNLIELKTKIKELASNQLSLKNQRKTVNLAGTRTMPTWEASYKHSSNREELRSLYMAYGIIRGKNPEDIERNPKTPINQRLVDKLVEQYKFTPNEEETAA
jgi:hypothetical protein